MKDRELLEAAAKSIGLWLEWDGDPEKWVPMYYEGKTYHSFDALDDNDVAFQIAVRLKFTVGHDMDFPTGPIVWIRQTGEFGGKYEMAEPHGDDAERAVRHAIVCAAAGIWRQTIGASAPATATN